MEKNRDHSLVHYYVLVCHSEVCRCGRQSETSELHRIRRPGRVYVDTDKDQFHVRVVKLRESKLKKWISDTTQTP